MIAVFVGMTACGGTALEESSDAGQTDRPDQSQTASTSGQTNSLRDAHFGETHVHTAYSLDAYIGAASLFGSWTDEHFDPEQQAFYYARALEIPTPRWSTYNAVRHDLPLLEDVPATIQERGRTSRIWHTP